MINEDYADMLEKRRLDEDAKTIPLAHLTMHAG